MNVWTNVLAISGDRSVQLCGEEDETASKTLFPHITASDLAFYSPAYSAAKDDSVVMRTIFKTVKKVSRTGSQ